MNYDMPVKILTQKDLIDAGCFDMKSAIDIVESAFVKYAEGDVIFPDKVSVVFDQMTQDRINCLPAAIISERVYGMKWVSVFPENPYKRNKPNLSAVYLISELESGYPIAFLEGTMCSNMRTASTSAVAAKYLAKKDCKTIGFIGAGEQAKAHFLAMKTVYPSLEECYISSRTRQSEEIFARQMKRFYPEIKYELCEGDYRRAACQADIIITAISGQEKILQAEWIQKGALYCHIAGLEDDFSVPAKADKIICDSWNAVKHRTQTISQMYQQSLLSDNDIYADLHEIITGSKTGRENDQEFIYFNNVGMSFVDTALSYWMFQKADKAGVGQTINLREKSMFEL